MNALGFGLIFSLKDDYSAQAAKIQSRFASITDASDKMLAKVSQATSGMQAGLMGIGIGAGILAPFGMAISKASEFEKQMSSVKSVMSPADVTKFGGSLRNLAMEMGAKTSFSATQAAKGIEELVKAGVSMTDIMSKNGLSGALDLAVAGELELADAAEIASTALNAFKKDGMNIRGAADILAGAANASATSVKELKFSLAAVGAVASGAGLSFKDTNTALAVLAQNGLKGSDAGTSLKTMLMNLSPKTKQATDEMRRLGLMASNGQVAFFNAKGEVKSMAEISGVLKNSLKNLNPKQQGDALEKLFGSDAIRAGNIFLKEGAEGINKMAAEMDKIKVANVAKEKLNNFAGAVTMLGGTMETIAIQIGSLFLPTLTWLVQSVDSVIGSFSAIADTPMGKTIALLTAAVGLLAVGLGGFVLVTNLATFASAQASIAFASMGKTSIATAFATQGLAGGLRAVMVSLLPLLIKVALIIAPLVIAYKAFEYFKGILAGTIKPMTDAQKMFAKIGASIWAVGQVITSWDGKSFDLGGMEKQLQASGLLQQVISVAQWTLRFIEFLRGIGQGLMYVFNAVGTFVYQVYNVISAAVLSFMKALGLQNSILGENKSNIDNWLVSGRAIGNIIGGVLIGLVVLLTIQLIMMAVAVIAATWPILAIIAAIAGIVAIIYYWGDITKWITKIFWQSVDAIGGFIEQIPNYFLQAMELGWWILKSYYTKFLPFVAGVILKIGYFLLVQVPYYIGLAFVTAMQWALNAIIKYVPILIGAVWNFLSWVFTNIPNWIGQAFTAALNLAQWIVLNGIPMLITGFFDFLNWIFISVPTWIGQAFITAIAWVWDSLGSFFTQAGEYFYNLGNNIGNMILQGLQSAWGAVSQWTTDALNSLTMGYNVFGTTEGQGQAANASTISNNNPSQIGNTIAQMQGIKAQQNNQTTIERNNNSAENFVFNFDFEGEKITKIVNKGQRMEQSRK
jgi:TP901 family phage tail tape measure protein